MRSWAREDRSDVLTVLSPHPAEDQYVVKEDEDAAAKEQAQDGVHECLERGRHVGEAEWHYQELKVAEMGAERRLVDVIRVHV
jgi:hypothetical protein